MSDTPLQLTLEVGRRGACTFENFVTGRNEQAYRIVRAAAEGGGERLIYLWGAHGSGKSHLLEASCRALAAREAPAAHLALGESAGLDAALLSGLEAVDMVCVDDIDSVAGDQTWEEALFHLYNACEQAGTTLIVAAGQVAAAAQFTLPDLASRLAAGVVLQLRPLGEADRGSALKLRARERGFEIPDDVADFLLRHYRRDTHSLFALLERLDSATLVAKRRVTVPFVKGFLQG